MKKVDKLRQEYWEAHAALKAAKARVSGAIAVKAPATIQRLYVLRQNDAQKRFDEISAKLNSMEGL